LKYKFQILTFLSRQTQDAPLLPTGNTRIFPTGNIIFLDLFFSYDGLFKKAKNNKIVEGFFEHTEKIIQLVS
jgi:hypothetical protein